MATNIQTPSAFDCQKPEQWPGWFKRFERFMNAADLNAQPDQKKIDTLLYVMGEKAEDLLTSFHLSAHDAGKIQEGNRSVPEPL